MNMQSQSLLDEWKKLAQIENKRMRKNMDGAPFGDSVIVNDTARIARISAEAIDLLRANGPMQSQALMWALQVGHETWVQVRDHIRDTGQARRVGSKKDAKWEVVE